MTLANNSAYCVKEKRKVIIQNARQVKMKNGGSMMKGKDAAGHTVVRIVSGGRGRMPKPRISRPRATPKRGFRLW